MQKLNEYLVDDIYSVRDHEHFDSKRDFLIKTLGGIGLKVQDHESGGGGADTVFDVRDSKGHRFGLAVFVDRQKVGSKNRLMTIKIKSSYIENDIEMYKTNLIKFFKDNGIKFEEIRVQETTNSGVTFPIIVIHMKNEFCPWNNK